MFNPFKKEENEETKQTTTRTLEKEIENVIYQMEQIDDVTSQEYLTLMERLERLINSEIKLQNLNKEQLNEGKINREVIFKALTVAGVTVLALNFERFNVITSKLFGPLFGALVNNFVRRA